MKRDNADGYVVSDKAFTHALAVVKESLLYGLDPETMMILAKSQIKTCGENIRLVEEIKEISDLFSDIPEDVMEQDIVAAISQYDGDGQKPYSDLVCCGLRIIQRYLANREIYEEWTKGSLSEN